MPRTPINYEKSVVYKLCCRDPEIRDIYIGSTTDVTRRKSSHRHMCNNPNDRRYNYYVYQFIRDNGGWDNWDVVVLEKYAATDKADLHRKERWYIETLGASLNKIIPTRTMAEYYEDHKDEIVEYKKQYYEDHKDALNERAKQYYEDHKDEIAERRKQYYEAHKDEIAERGKIYRENNKDKITEYKKQYHENNRDRLLEKAKVYRENNRDKLREKAKVYHENNKEKSRAKYVCECGSTITRRSKARHEGSEKHMRYVETISSDNNETAQ